MFISPSPIFASIFFVTTITAIFLIRRNDERAKRVQIFVENHLTDRNLAKHLLLGCEM